MKTDVRSLSERLDAIELRLHDVENRQEPDYVQPGTRVSCRLIICLVAIHSGISETAILSPVREASIVRARFAAYWLARETTGLSLPQIGRQFDRDHTTIVAGIVRANELRLEDRSFLDLTDRLLGIIRGVRS